MIQLLNFEIKIWINDELIHCHSTEIQLTLDATDQGTNSDWISILNLQLFKRQYKKKYLQEKRLLNIR